MENKKIIGGAILTTGLGLAWYCFNWQLALILWLVLWGNNLEQK